MIQLVRDVGSIILAIILVATFCLILLFQIVNKQVITIPDSLLVLVSGVVAFFFGQHAVSNGATNARQTAAATAAAIVNGHDGKSDQSPTV